MPSQYCGSAAASTSRPEPIDELADTVSFGAVPDDLQAEVGEPIDQGRHGLDHQVRPLVTDETADADDLGVPSPVPLSGVDSRRHGAPGRHHEYRPSQPELAAGAVAGRRGHCGDRPLPIDPSGPRPLEPAAEHGGKGREVLAELTLVHVMHEQNDGRGRPQDQRREEWDPVLRVDDPRDSPSVPGQPQQRAHVHREAAPRPHHLVSIAPLATGATGDPGRQVHDLLAHGRQTGRHLLAAPLRSACLRVVRVPPVGDNEKPPIMKPVEERLVAEPSGAMAMAGGCPPDA